MKDKQVAFKIYHFSHPLMQTEMISLAGDKYKNVLPFEWTFVNSFNEADVVVWDGIITPRNQGYIRDMLENIGSTKALLLLGESLTLFRNHPMVQELKFDSIKKVEVAGWNILPEEILAAFEACREQLTHV
jgi:Ni,Fe-hydrogenase III small subunit